MSHQGPPQWLYVSFIVIVSEDILNETYTEILKRRLRLVSMSDNVVGTQFERSSMFCCVTSQVSAPNTNIQKLHATIVHRVLFLSLVFINKHLWL